MDPSRLALRNPHAVIVACLAIIMIGGISLQRMPVDILPQFLTPAVQVVTTYNGMPANLVEEDITNRLERWTSQATGIATQTSRSLLGASVIKNFFHDDVSPSAALTQVSALALSDLHYLPPGTFPPIVSLFDPTASTPVALVAIGSDTLDETTLYDIGYYQIRSLLAGTAGVIAPSAYGGKIRQIMVYVDKDKLEARNLSSTDIVKALHDFNIMLPTGDAQIGDFDYMIDSNAMVPTVSSLNDIPIKFKDGRPVFIRDVAHAEDSAAFQKNAVRIDGRRAVYIPIYRQPGANTIAVVDGVKASLPDIQGSVTHGDQLKLKVLMDQSVYVRDAISGLEREGLMGFGLAAVAVLLFLGSLRSAGIVALTLPLAVLPAFILLYFAHQTINVMTLGGLALAVGMVMDNAIIVLENIARHLEEGARPLEAASKGSEEIASAVLVATLTLCIVFAPVALMTGIGKFLFTPLALAVVFALAASYFISLSVVPISCASWLAAIDPHHDVRKSWFERLYGVVQKGYERSLHAAMKQRAVAVVIITSVVAASFLIFPLLGTELFPEVDSGQFTVLMRGPSGTTLDRTEQSVARVEDTIKHALPAGDVKMVVSNIGVPRAVLAPYSPNAGPQDAFVLVQLNDPHQKSPQEDAALLRERLPQAVPGAEFSFDTAGLIASALNFGLISPIDVQVSGPHMDVSRHIAEAIERLAAHVSGAVDLHIQQRLDYPQITLDVSRTRAAAMGLTSEDVFKNVVADLNSSVNFAQNFWVDSQTGNNYFIGASYRFSDINSLASIADIPITGANQKTAVPLRNLATIGSGKTILEADHLNLKRVVDIYAGVAGRDLGGVSNDIQTLLDRVNLPKAYHVRLLG
ncbi:MAG TPA: efflux RND transporter permease subunit, partial [Candidatus Xenobia bacterium]